MSFWQGGPPEPWELAIGDTAERVGRQGRTVIDYATKMNAMGVHEQSLAGDVNPVADHVASIGRNTMRLMPGNPAVSVRKAAALQGNEACLGRNVVHWPYLQLAVFNCSRPMLYHRRGATLRGLRSKNDSGTCIR